jgi:hypothetical protein
MRIPALGSLRNLRRHLAPTARSRLGRGRLQGNVSTVIEWPAPKGLAQLSWVLLTTLYHQEPLDP